jgi:HAE1 family hydrophobic/amphiphilic exporter-1
MLAYKISSDEVMEALSESLEASPGKQEASGKRSQAFECIKYSGRFTTKEHMGNIIYYVLVLMAKYFLKDVANVEFGSSMYDIYSNLNGRPSAVFVLKQSFGSNANQVISDLKAKLEVIEKSLKGIMRYLMMYLNFRCFNRKSNSYASRSFYFSRLSRFSFPGRLEINCDTGNCGSCVSLVGTFMFMQLLTYR